MDYTSLLLYAFALLTFAYQIFRSRVRKGELFLLAAFAAAAALIFWREGALSPVLICGLVIFNAIFNSYGERRCKLYLLLGIYYLLVALAVNNLNISLVLQSAVIGVLSAPRNYLIFSRAVRKGKTKLRTELPRNLFQIGLGIIAIGLFFFLPLEVAALLLLFAFLLGIAVGSYALNHPKGALHRTFSKMEREGSELGHGAAWLGIGTLFAAAFLNSNLVIVVFAAIFIADSLSTIVGIRYGKTRMPYNKKKSIAGTFTYAACVLIIAYPVIGIVSVPMAILAALAESLPLQIDDNLAVSLILTVALRLIY